VLDDLTQTARRIAATRPEEADDLEGRFRTLVQSPLRAGILRFLSANPEKSFDIESLMATFGRLRLDVENCLRELVDFGVAYRNPGPPPSYAAAGRSATGSCRCSIASSSGAPRSPWRIRRRRCSASAK
jgi:hypothetical protein